MNVRRGVNAVFFTLGLSMVAGGGLGAKAEFESAAHNFAAEWNHLGTAEGERLADARRQDIYEGLSYIALSSSGAYLMYSVARDELGAGPESEILEITDAELGGPTDQPEEQVLTSIGDL